MTIDNAIEMLKSEYEKALNLSYVRNPISFALYSVWRKADKVEKQPVDLSFKCGSCKFAKPTAEYFGGSCCYVECTNERHLLRYCKRDISRIRQRTQKCCKLYEIGVMKNG